MNAPVTRPQLVEFVAAVRANLDDLSQEEIEELTGGLEADLDDALADSGRAASDRAPGDQFGDPVAYAAELRSSAGLPPRPGPVPGPGPTPPAAGWHDRLADWVAAADRLQAQPWARATGDFLVTLRPAWWLLRAWAGFALICAILGIGDGPARGSWPVPADLGGWLVLVVMAVVSVQIGRLALARRHIGWRLVIAVGNTVAVLIMLALLAQSSAFAAVPHEAVIEPVPGGLSPDGDPVATVVAFDEQGRPLTGVRLFDQDGRPLQVVGPVPAPTFSSRPMITETDPADGRPTMTITASPPLPLRTTSPSPPSTVSPTAPPTSTTSSTAS